MRSTRGHTGNRRSHHALNEMRFSTCASCGALHLRHRVCSACGKYRGRVVVDLAKAAERVQKKKQKKETAAKQ